MDKAKAALANRIFERVLKEIKPSDTEVKASIANVNLLMSRLKRIVPRNVELRVAGSIARGTNLKGNADIDIFMLFDKSVEKERLVELGLQYGKRVADRKKGERYEIKYAEHPYVRLHLGDAGIRVDLVPAQRIERIEALATAVDRTPLHTEFINSHLTDRQRDEVRLLKYLLKSHDIYGAEVKTGGFSGYLCEILIHQFGSLLKLLEAISVLRIPMVLDPKNKAQIKDERLAHKFNSDFVVIDPVDPERNVAAAVSRESLSRLIIVSRRFLANPAIRVFYGYGFSSIKTRSMLNKFIKDTGLDVFLIVLNVPNKSNDVIWPQLRKVAKMVADNVDRLGAEAYLTTQWVDGRKGVIFIAAPRRSIATRLIKGPDTLKTSNTQRFISSHKNSFGFLMDGSTIYTLERNRYSNAEGILRDVVKGKLVRKHKEISLNGARLFVNGVPDEYSETAYVELRRLLSI